MTTGVNVDFISNCFFTCKDRALERDRPYQRKKILLFCLSMMMASNDLKGIEHVLVLNVSTFFKHSNLFKQTNHVLM